MKKFYFWSATRTGRALMGMAACAGVLLSAACASSPSASDLEHSAWTKEAVRTVESGSIVHLGQAEEKSGTSTGEPDRERTIRRAEAQALQDIANECSFVPKGTKIQARAATKTSAGYRAWARATVGVQACEEGKRTVEPKAIRRLADAEFTAQVREFQLAQSDHSLLSSLADVSNSDSGEASVAPPPAPIRDEIHLYVVRQQLVFAKQAIILDQDRQPAVSPAHLKSGIEARTTNLRKFEEAHPEFKRTPRSWSNFGREAVLHSPWVSPLVRRPNPPVGKERAARWLNSVSRSPSEASSERGKSKKSLKKKKTKKPKAKRSH